LLYPPKKTPTYLIENEATKLENKNEKLSKTTSKFTIGQENLERLLGL